MKRYLDNNNARVYFISILTFILCGLIVCLEKNFSIAVVIWLLYAIYLIIHIEIQDNHNKIITYLNNINKRNKELNIEENDAVK